ncbi:unnamed protein product [Caenorhabditis sp. 36 PRJEB53466]|nr:unnamed protein product [Caenorhabditis sp. 36 PRJEB53466]
MKADPNMPDTNGNTVLHLTVIHDLPEMFMLAVELGANLHVRNNLKLTPLALAARLAKKQIYDLILECDMDISWRYGPVVCKAYPLNDVDTIQESDGSLNPNSVIANVVYGDKVEHLEFFDGLIEEVLESKWQTFGKKHLFKSLAGYIYFLTVFYVAFMTRDAHILNANDEEPEDIEADFSNFTNILSTGLSLREHLAIARFENIMEDGWEAVMRMFIMSVGEFGALYKNLNECKSSIAPQSKVFFILFELIVTVMLLNLLIAMMTRTYEKIAETEKEWKRQVILPL